MGGARKVFFRAAVLFGGARNLVHITAHSGCDDTPDNSLAFVRHALQTSADALEVDVRKTEDGILAISHDAIVAGQDAPALSDVFALVAQSNRWVNCDLKEPDLENAVIDLARAHGLLQRLIFSGTVSPARVQQQPSLRKDARIYINIEELIPGLYQRLEHGDVLTTQVMEQAAALCKQYGFEVINVYEALCVPAFMQVMDKARIRVSAWTVNDPARAAEIAAYSVTENITSRAPERIRQAVEDAHKESCCCEK